MASHLILSDLRITSPLWKSVNLGILTHEIHMARKLLSLMALACFLCTVPGCGPGGGEAAFEETSAQTEEEIQEAEDYGEPFSLRSWHQSAPPIVQRVLKLRFGKLACDCARRMHPSPFDQPSAARPVDSIDPPKSTR